MPPCSNESEPLIKCLTNRKGLPPLPKGLKLSESSKEATIDRLTHASLDAKRVSLGDKLSNMRAIARDYAVLGDALWSRFHTSDPEEHAWHYRGLANALRELEETEAYREFESLVNQVFSK